LEKFHGIGLSNIGSIRSSLIMPVAFSRNSETIQTEEVCESRSYWDQIWTKYLIPKGTKSDLALEGPKPKIYLAFLQLFIRTEISQLKILLVIFVHKQKWEREEMEKHIFVIVCCFLIAWEPLDTMTVRSLKNCDR